MPARFSSPANLFAYAALLALVAGTNPVHAAARARATLVPSWIDPEPLDPRGSNVTVPADRGVVWLLSDIQFRATAKSERYIRRAFRVDASTGIGAVSELRLDYDPSFETLAVHFVHILRGDQTIDGLREADWTVIQPESDFDRRIYSGQEEGLLFLQDVRVGDVIDYAYSIRGSSPVLGGHIAQQISLEEYTGVAELRRRIVTDVARRLKIAPHGERVAPVETSVGSIRQLTWRLTNAAPVEREDRVPGWYRQGGWIDVSDFASWNEVATASAALFDTKGTPSSEMAAQVATWARDLPTDDARALAATRFVQDEIRYLGIEIGPHTHQPFPPATVLKRRFGDCKDKALLLVTLLRSLGIAADPALVDTTSGRQLDDLLPSPFAFDHAIVRATIGGKVVFIDATSTMERGPLTSRPPPPYARALLVSRDTRGLIPLGDPRPARPTYDVDETYTLKPAGGGPVRLDVVTTFREDRADEMRAEIASSPRSELARRYVNYYAEEYPDVRALGDPAFDDDTTADVLVVRESYEIPGFWRDGERGLYPSSISGYLRAPAISRRTMPLGVSFPARVAEHFHIRGATGEFQVPEASDGHDEAVRFRSAGRLENGTLTLDYEYEALADSVAVAHVPSHLALLERTSKEWSYTLEEPASEPTRRRSAQEVPAWAWWTVGGAAALAGAVWLTRAGLLWRRRQAFRKRASIANGEAPTKPLVVADEAAIELQIGKARCACRARLVPTPNEPMAELRLGERTVRAVQLACRACGDAKRIYFEVRTR